MKPDQFIALLYLCTAVFLAACDKNCKDKNRPVSSYLFELPATLTPLRDTYQVGDTITVRSEFDDMVFELETQKRYHLENWKFYPGTILHKIDTVPAKQEFAPYFDFFVSDIFAPRLVNNEVLSTRYSYDEGKYKLEIILIPKIEGLYYLEQGSSLYPQDEWQDFPGKCRNISSEALVTLNNSDDNNIEFLRHSPDPHYSEWILLEPEARFHKGGGYCFYVVE